MILIYFQENQLICLINSLKPLIFSPIPTDHLIFEIMYESLTNLKISDWLLVKKLKNAWTITIIEKFQLKIDQIGRILVFSSNFWLNQSGKKKWYQKLLKVKFYSDQLLSLSILYQWYIIEFCEGIQNTILIGL